MQHAVVIRFPVEFILLFMTNVKYFQSDTVRMLFKIFAIVRQENIMDKKISK